MKHDGVEQPARVPVTSVPHWEGNGWEKTDPPPKPVRRTPAPVEPDAPKLPEPETPTDFPVDTRASAKPKTAKAAPAGRKED